MVRSVDVGRPDNLWPPGQIDDTIPAMSPPVNTFPAPHRSPFLLPARLDNYTPGRLEKPVQNRAFLARFYRCIYRISVRTAGVCGRCRPAEREGPSTASPGGMEADNLCSGTAARLNYGIGAAWAGVDWLTSRQLGPSSAPLGLAQLRPTRLD